MLLYSFWQEASVEKLKGCREGKRTRTNGLGGLELAKTLVRTVELMEVERERDVPHSVNSVCSSQCTSLLLASQSYLSSLPLDSKMVEMNKVSGLTNSVKQHISW